MKIKVPKRIPVERLRERLGDKRVEEMLLSLYGPTVNPLKIPLSQYQKTLDLLTGKIKAQNNLVPNIFRAYFSENAYAERTFLKWLEGQIQTQSETPVENNHHRVIKRKVKSVRH